MLMYPAARRATGSAQLAPFFPCFWRGCKFPSQPFRFRRWRPPVARLLDRFLDTRRLKVLCVIWSRAFVSEPQAHPVQPPRRHIRETV